MGYLTPFLVHNDAAHMLLKDPKLGEKLYNATQSFKDEDILLQSFKKNPWWKFWKKRNVEGAYHGYLECLSTAHADTDRVIVIHGNSWIDLTNAKDRGYIYFEECLNVADREVKRLKKSISGITKVRKMFTPKKKKTMRKK